MGSTKPYVFISYAHKNSDRVFPCLKEMQDQGIELWYDNGIIAGSEWPEFVAEKVANCDKFVLFVSKAYLESQNCKRELNFAISRKKDILSIYLEEVELSPGMEMQLGTYQAIFRSRFASDQQLFRALPAEPFFNPCKKGEAGEVQTSAPQSTPVPEQRASSYTPPSRENPYYTSTPPRQEAPHQSSNPFGSSWINDQRPKKSKVIAVLLAVFLGWLGAHKFYLGKNVPGVLYFLFCWTRIPLLLGWIDAVILLVQSNEKLSEKYNCKIT